MIKRIYFETNSLRGRWPVVSGELLILCKLASVTGVGVLIPQSVIIEHEHSTFREIRDEVNAAGKKVRAAKLLLSDLLTTLSEPEFAADQIRKAYHEAIAASLKRYEIGVPPITAKTVEDFVRFAADRVPPFKNEDRGFRDAVHLHSIIEHLRAAPLDADGTAVLISGDKRLSHEDVKEMLKRADVPLSVVEGLSDVIVDLTAQLKQPTRDQLARLTAMWRPAVLEDVRRRLLSKLMDGAKGLDIGRGVRLDSIFAGGVDWEWGADSIAPSGPEQPSVYPYSFEIRLHLAGVGAKSVDGREELLNTLQVTLLVSVDATVDTDNRGNPVRIVYTSARAFCTIWKERNDLENFPQSVEMLKEPV